MEAKLKILTDVFFLISLLSLSTSVPHFFACSNSVVSGRSAFFPVQSRMPRSVASCDSILLPIKVIFRLARGSTMHRGGNATGPKPGKPSNTDETSE